MTENTFVIEIEIEELEQKVAPSTQWDPVLP
jgi:hypothetical protein